MRRKTLKKLFIFYRPTKKQITMHNFNAALLTLVLIASAMDVLAAPATDDSKKRSISMSINL